MREMKDSGVEWIGEIPAQWNLSRIQNCLQEIKEKNFPVRTSQVLSLVKDKGVMLYEDKGNIGNKSKDDITEYKIAYPNTLIVNSMNILIGSVGISNYFGCVSPVYYVFKETDKSDLRFINYIFNTNGLQKELRKYANGILEIRLRVSANDIFKQKIPLPSKDEQTRLADFLDAKCAESDALSADIQAQIDTLEQYKRSVITEAVTKGLKPDAEMRDSGIPWMAKLPQNWHILRKLSYATQEDISYGIVKLFEPDDESGIKVIRCSDVMEGYISKDNIRTVTQSVSAEYSRTILNGGEVILNIRGSLGGCAVVPNSMAGYNIAREVAKISIKKPLFNRYLMYFLLSTVFSHYLQNYLVGSVYIGLNIETLKSCPVPLPPMGEQVAISEYLDEKCAEIDTTIADKQAQLETLADYKKSLIFEYVTGKKEVPAS